MLPVPRIQPSQSRSSRQRVRCSCCYDGNAGGHVDVVSGTKGHAATAKETVAFKLMLLSASSCRMPLPERVIGAFKVMSCPAVRLRLWLPVMLELLVMSLVAAKEYCLNPANYLIGLRLFDLKFQSCLR